MNVYKVVYRETAVADILDVYRTVYEGSLNLVAACQRIGEAPFDGLARDDLSPGLRTVSFERRAVIAYLVKTETVVITNVFYSGRDYEALDRHD